MLKIMTVLPTRVVRHEDEATPALRSKYQCCYFFGLPKRQEKIYNSQDSHVVTHHTTNWPVYGLSMAEQTESPVLHTLWLYVLRTCEQRPIDYVAQDKGSLLSILRHVLGQISP